MKSLYLHPFHKSRNMNRYPITGYVLGILIVLVLAGCRGRSGGEEEQKQVQKQEESWHMTDEIKQLQAGPAEEEAFRMAAHDGKLEQLKKLHAQGVACDATDQDGHTALMFAAFNGHSEIVIYLLDAGAEIDRTDYMDRTALLYGATGPFPETVKILLDHGADPNRVDSDEHFSPLMHAAAEGHLEVVKVLINHGADRSLKDVDGDNAADFAAQSGHMQVAEYLDSLTD
jgi:ankyrin repeat protein